MVPHSVAREVAPLALVVSAGGVLGAVGRLSLDTAIPRADLASWPWATFVINISGSFLLGLLLVLLLARFGESPATRAGRWARPFLVTGVLGGFTTFSAFSAQVRDLLATSPAMALAYSVGSVLCCVLAVAVGSALAHRLVGSAAEPSMSVLDES